MEFSRSSQNFEGGLKEPVVVVLAYGSARLLPRTPDQHSPDFDVTRIANLFNPFEPLNDASTWLAELSDKTFDHVARSLKIPLRLEQKSRLLRVDGRVFADLFGQRVSLEELSDGYQSMLALITDIMRVALLSGWETIEQTEGVVLLDEIGSHLHPRLRGGRLVGPEGFEPPTKGL